MFAAILDQLKQGKISYEETRDVLISTLNSSPELHIDITDAIDTAKNSPLTQAQQQELIGLVNDITEQTDDPKTRIVANRTPRAINPSESVDDLDDPAIDDSTVIKPNTRKNSSDIALTEQIDQKEESNANITTTEVITETAATAMHKTQISADSSELHSQNVVSDQLKPGDTLKGRFVLEELIGQGGMGMVFKARDLRKEEAMDSNPYVAVKVLGGSFKDHPQALISLQRESRKAQTLAHPNIVTVYDFDRDGDTAFMTMEYLEGDSLDRVIKKQHPKAFSKEKALLITDGICNGLAYAHSHNIIHADLKPGNVYVTKNNIVKIFDFGIARAMTTKEGEQKVDSLSGETTLFDAGDLGGITPAYASFEMLTGQDPDTRDDIYALACIAYELLAGFHPFKKLPANQASERQLSPPAVANISRKQFRGLERGLRFERERRTPSVSVFQDDLCNNKTSSKVLISSIVMAIVIIIFIVAIPLSNYFDNQEIAEIVDKLNSENDQVISATLQDIESIEPRIGKSALENGKDAVIKYFQQKAIFYTDGANQRYNFDAANRELDSADKLYRDSAKLKEIRLTIDRQKSDLLSTLTQRFNTHIDAENLISDPNSDDLVETLAQIAQIESSHALLHDERISFAYSQAAEKAANSKNFSRAEQFVVTGLVLLPKDRSLINIKKAITAANADGGSKKRKLASFKLSLEKSITPQQRKLSIDNLLKKPFKNKQWHKTLATQLKLLKKKLPKTDPWLTKNIELIERIYVSHAEKLRNAKRFTDAAKIIADTKKLIPVTKTIKNEEKRIKTAKKRFKMTQIAEAKVNRITSVKKTLLSQSRANNVKAANENLRILKKLLPAKDNFLTNEAPKAISDAYLKLAQNSARRGDYRAAITLVKSGLNLSPRHGLLKTSLQNYQSRLPNLSNSSNVKSSDPCRSNFAGHGKRSRATCHDKLGKQTGPTLIVIPAGQSIAAAFAISKYEISIADYNIYCKTSKQCNAKPGAANLPISGISFSEAKNYRNWLTKTSGYTYRIPTDVEWMHAAKAGGKQPAKDFNCQVSLGGNLIKGISLINTRSGKSNGWGLTNYVGNVQEWVLKDSAVLHVRGGSFKNSLSTCDLNYSRPHNGKLDKITGLRLIRELK